MLIIPSFLGLYQYGQLTYLASTLIFIISFFSFSTEHGFVYYLSSKDKSKNINNYFYLFIFLSILFLLFLSISIINNFLNTIIWKSAYEINIFIYAAIYALLFSFQQRLSDLADGIKKTNLSESIKFLCNSFSTIFIYFLITSNFFSIDYYFILQTLSMILYLYFVLPKLNISISKINFSDFKSYISKLFKYTKNIFIYSTIALSFTFFTRYVLVSSGGFDESAIYVISYQYAVFPVILLSSISFILLNDLSIIIKKNAIKEIKIIFLERFHKFVFIYSIIIFLLLFNAEEIFVFIYEQEAIKFIMTFKVLIIFSFFHIFSLFSNQLLFAMNKSKIYGLANNFFQLLGIIILAFILLYYKVTSVEIALVVLLIFSFRSLCTFFISLYYLKISLLFYFIKIISIITFVLIYFILCSLLGFKFIFQILLVIPILVYINFTFNNFLDFNKKDLKFFFIK